MINSRKISDLSPQVAAKCTEHVFACRKRGVSILVTSTYRDYEAQEALYAQGRTAPGQRVTRARAGKSWHNFRCAWDVVPLDAKGKPIWDTKNPARKVVHEEARKLEIECGADWPTYVDFPHLQVLPKKLTFAQARVLFDAKGTLFG